ncbi:MAG: hypothetical protein ABSF64_18970 [Bryobacteraceae bacterium]
MAQGRFSHAVGSNPFLAVPRRYKTGSFSKLIQALILKLNRDINRLVGNIRLALLLTDTFEDLLKARPASKGAQATLYSIYPPIRHWNPPISQYPTVDVVGQALPAGR